MVGAKCEAEIITIFHKLICFYHIPGMNAFFNVSLLDLDFNSESLTAFKVVSKQMCLIDISIAVVINTVADFQCK